ncbi:hypothetical protein DCAR_0417716 [Daucus carota subsp. sativus]|uniref:Uncharacterized protein n=1 Tax=Daucus carota subsp. sativus TaxID=79200 RepID=A0A165YW26_DAUCS|nr:PREDICTED: O-acyltransferase WSD1-like [Daucus carota subsp. sativus]WOG98375.1 hypothetical protein DCAR_0417716 [Daucus carota subsp. sativus]
MELEEGEVPVSPSGQYLNSDTLSFTILAVLEFEVPVDNLNIIQLIKDMFISTNPRFSSIMIGGRNEVKRWKPVQVQVEDHVKTPEFPPGESPEVYDKCFEEYMSDLAMDPLPQTRPLWEVHVIKNETSNAAGTVILKLHHALGDGYTLIGLLISTFKKADDPSLPLTFPSLRSSSKLNGNSSSIFRVVPRILQGIINTITDFGTSILKKEDDRSPIRSANEGVEIGPRNTTTITFSLDTIKQIKSRLNVTVNDVITGIILYGSRMYMEEESFESRNANSSALVVFNTRNIGRYKSVDEMVKPNANKLWGNQFTLSHVPIPKLSHIGNSSNPLEFIREVHKTMDRKKKSSAVYMTASLIECVRKFRGPEVAAKLIHGTLKDSSVALSNLIGPVEQMALQNHPVKGFYFTVAGVPVSTGIAVVSYMGKLRVAITSEKGYIDADKFKSSILKAFNIVCKITADV